MGRRIEAAKVYVHEHLHQAHGQYLGMFAFFAAATAPALALGAGMEHINANRADAAADALEDQPGSNQANIDFYRYVEADARHDRSVMAFWLVADVIFITAGAKGSRFTLDHVDPNSVYLGSPSPTAGRAYEEPAKTEVAS